MYVVYDYCNASSRGSLLWEGNGFLRKKEKVSVRDMDSINVLEIGLKISDVFDLECK